MISGIKMFVESVNYSILVSGKVVGCFRGKKGLRQGDTMSPFLFTLVMEMLSCLLREGLCKRRFIAHPRCKSINLTNICFADDIIIFVKADYKSLTGIIDIINIFSDYAGLKMNQLKSMLIVGSVPENEATLWANDLGIQLTKLCSNRINVRERLPLIETITSRM